MEIQRTGRQTDRGTWLDLHGFEGPFQPGVGPRTDPMGAFPTGPRIGERLPDIVAPTSTGQIIDVHDARNDGSLVMVFFRSAVW